MSRVIRGPRPAAQSGNLGREGRRKIVPGEVFDARTEAEEILANARAAAEATAHAAEEDAARVRAEAERAGRDEGIARAAALLAEAGSVRDRALADAEREAVSLALAAAHKIVGEELALAPERIAAIVAEVLGRARRAQRVVVRAHPDDAPVLESLRERISTRAGSSVTFAVEPDTSITRGGCVLVTDVGELDARIEVKLAAFARALGVET